ncbi:MAG: carboxypeptidase regulatory-like domain-containing protein [Pyrinomonadaceae bacterium]
MKVRNLTGYTTLGLLLGLLLCVSAAAQETTGGIEGTVRDPAGALVPSVTITITSARTVTTGTTTTGIGFGFKRTVTTNEEGFFRVLQIPPGNYDLVTEPTGGFGSARYENVAVAIGQNTQLSISVNPGGEVNTVDVTVSDAPPVDTTNSAIQTAISAQKIELLPKGTGFTSILKSVPGTRPESRTGGFSVDGASGGENVFVIDGQEVTNYRTGTLNDTFDIPTQLVQEVQVKSSGFNAEYGGATGGVVSVVTRGGSNEFHGEFGLQFAVPRFNGNPRRLLGGTSAASSFFTQNPEYFQPPKSGGTDFFPTANLGGPILKDRVWFFGSYSPQVFNTEVNTQYFTNQPAATRTLLTSHEYTRKTRYEYAFARVDGNPLDNVRLSGTFLWNPVIQEGSLPGSSFSNVSSSSYVFNNSGIPVTNFGGSIGSLSETEFRPKQGGRQNSNVVTFSGVYTPTSSIVIDGRYSRGFLNEKLGNYFVPQVVNIASCNRTPANNPDPFPCSTTGANSLTVKDISIRETYEFSGAYIFEGGGRHELKGGYQRYTILNDVQSGNNAIGQLRFFVGTPISSTQPGVVDTPGAIGSASFRRTGTNGQGSNLSQGIFIQDKWQPMSRLSLNLGIRFEKENLPTFNGIPSGVDFGWGDKIAPRLGFAYDPFGDGKTKIFGSYGKFYDRVKFALPRGLFGGDIFLEDYFEIFPGDTASDFNIVNVLGGFTGPSVCPSTGFITAGARSRCQRNLRVNANEPGASPYENGAVDPNLNPFQQTELTFGLERQLGRDYVIRTRYTYKNVDEAVEDAGIVNSAGSEAYIIGNPGTGLHLQTLQDLGYERSTRPKRRYDGFEVVLEKRLSANWYFNANYTFSRLHGNYSGLSSSDEPHLVNGRLSPGVSRAFDLPFIGFTAEGEPDNGPLPTDRPHVFNIYGAYIFNWMGSKSNTTEFAAFQTIASGAPMTTSIYGQSSVTPQIFYHRGDLGRSPTFTQTDFNVTHRFKFGADGRYMIAADLNFINLWDQDTVTGVYPTMNTSTSRPNDAAMFPSNTPGERAQLYANGYTSGALLQPILDRFNADPTNRLDQRYGMPQLFQSPRAVRFGFRFLF